MITPVKFFELANRLGNNLTDSEFEQGMESVQRRIADLEAALADEVKIVDRIWEMFGRPSYKELAGRSIYDLISGLQKELAEKDRREGGAG